jgi:hypothetical protein
MAGIFDPMLDMFLQLEKQGWTIVNMAEYEPNIAPIAAWCRNTLGDMLINPDVDVSRWFGAVITYGDNPAQCLFAFRDPADYTLLKLKWA